MDILYHSRQEKLEQLAARFDGKAGMRETWLSENKRLVSQDNFGYDLAAVEAATKKQILMHMKNVYLQLYRWQKS